MSESPWLRAVSLPLARALDPGDFRQTVEKIGLYKFGDDTPLTPDEIAALADEVMSHAGGAGARTVRAG